MLVDVFEAAEISSHAFCKNCLDGYANEQFRNKINRKTNQQSLSTISNVHLRKSKSDESMPRIKNKVKKTKYCCGQRDKQLEVEKKMLKEHFVLK